MGLIKQGILGGFRNKVGTVVGFYWKGRAVMRSLAPSVHNPDTPGQREYRAKFKAMAQMFSAMLEVVRIGLRRYAEAYAISEYNAAVSINSSNGSFSYDQISGDVTVSYQDVQLADGSMQNVANPTATQGTGAVDFAWIDNTGLTPETLGTDGIVIAMYNVEKSVCLLDATNFHRADEAGTISYPALWAGDHAECYIFVTNGDNTDACKSVHLGSITLA